jgi:hypothetical protein
MLARLRSRRPGHATVVAYLALFVALGGTGAYAANEWTGENIVDRSLTRVDVAGGTLTGAEVQDFALTGSDIAWGSLSIAHIGAGSHINFVAYIGTVPARSCELAEITGVNADMDHMVLTPSANDASPDLSYSIFYTTDLSGRALLKSCNPTNSAINDVTTHFNLLVFYQ